MRRFAVVAVLLLVSMTGVSVAVAGESTYAGPWQWYPGQGAGSGYSATWLANRFATYGSGYDKAVTFIDNKSYSWHNTLRNRSDYTETYAPPSPMVKKAHCVAYSYGFWGSCAVRSSSTARFAFSTRTACRTLKRCAGAPCDGAASG